MTSDYSNAFLVYGNKVMKYAYKWTGKKVRLICCNAPKYRQCHHRRAQVHGAHKASSHVPALNLPSLSRYSFIDLERMEG